jgi:hypothetical protein
MHNASAYFVPSRSAQDLARTKDCLILSKVLGCAGRVVLGRNPFGAAYYHSMYDTLGSLAYVLEYMRSQNATVKILENVCNSDHDTLGEQKMLDPRVQDSLSRCAKGPLPFITEMLAFLGLDVRRDVQHYPYGRQLHGRSFFVQQATFDCSGASFRDFWHAIKLRAIFRAQFRTPPPTRRTIVLIDRNTCVRKVNNGECPWSGRGVRRQSQIFHLLSERFAVQESGNDDPLHNVVEFRGGSISFAEQAALFRRAAAIVGPHGAALANIIFCQSGTRVVEFLRKGFLPLYAGYANVFGLPYWPVVDSSSPPTGSARGGVRARGVAHTARSAPTRRSRCARRCWRLRERDDPPRAQL